jgi:hypothetical protein
MLNQSNQPTKFGHWWYRMTPLAPVGWGRHFPQLSVECFRQVVVNTAISTCYLVTAWTLCSMCAAGLFKAAIRYAALSPGIQLLCFAMGSDWRRNTAHEVDTSSFGVCVAPASVPVLWQDPRSARASVIEYSPNSRPPPASTPASRVLNSRPVASSPPRKSFRYPGLESSSRGIC